MMLSESLKIVRCKAFLSQKDFADELHIAVSTVNRWETGKAKPNVSTLRNIKEFCLKNNLDFEIVESAWLIEK